MTHCAGHSWVRSHQQEPDGRTDGAVAADVEERLFDDDQLDATDVVVTVKEGIVTLSGLVGTKEDRAHAVFIAAEVPGARGVHDLLRTRQGAGDLRH